MGDERVSFQLYRWNGEDSIPGVNRRDAHGSTSLICEIPRPDGLPLAKPEGVALMPKSSDEEEQNERFCIVYDIPGDHDVKATAIVYSMPE